MPYISSGKKKEKKTTFSAPLFEEKVRPSKYRVKIFHGSSGQELHAVNVGETIKFSITQ